MKLPLIFLSFFLIGHLYGQKGTIIIEDEKSDDQIILVGKNISDQDQQVTFILTSEGYKLSRKNSFTEIIPANSEIELIQLKPEPNKQWTYSYKYSHQVKQKEVPEIQERHVTPPPTVKQPEKVAAQIQTQKPENKITYDPEQIIVYTKNGCSRCTYAVEFLKENKINFEELNTQNKKNNEQCSRDLFASGFKGGRFTTPVIIARAEVHYNIKDLQGFLESLKLK